MPILAELHIQGRISSYVFIAPVLYSSWLLR
jgi:hypothetical protein